MTNEEKMERWFTGSLIFFVLLVTFVYFRDILPEGLLQYLLILYPVLIVFCLLIGYFYYKKINITESSHNNHSIYQKKM